MTGLLSFFPWVFEWWDARRPMGNTASASYCQSIWKFHRDNAGKVVGDSIKTVGELGPGATLGTSIAALLDGVDHVVALDAGRYASIKESVRLLRELSGGNASQDIVRIVESAGNPDKESSLRYAAPWTDPNVCPAESLDLIFSHSVLEHVSDPEMTYRACYRWLKPGGVMSHKIDHSSHGITKSWNGHYYLGPFLWALIYGRRPFLLNRRRPRQHIEDLRNAGFVIRPESRFVIDDGTSREIALEEFPTNDLVIRTSTILAAKPR